MFTAELDGSVGHVPAHIRIPAVRRPALAGLLTYLLGSCLAFGLQQLRGRRFDVIQATDCAFPRADLFYAHFCHRAFLHEVWPQLGGERSARRLHAWAMHRTRSLLEALLVRQADVVVVPSDGLRRDFDRVYPGTARKTTVIRNTVDLAHFEAPPEFDVSSVRERMGARDGDVVFVFVALGHFERKGLPLVIEALSEGGAPLDAARLWVVGGEGDLVASYRRRADELGVGDRVVFSGRTDDVRPYLWAADAFVAPSHYEAFSLGLLEAAAAGLPLVVTRISGSDELVEEGVNGIFVERTAEGVKRGLERFVALGLKRREKMRRAARASVEPLRPERFIAEWAALYDALAARASLPPA